MMSALQPYIPSILFFAGVLVTLSISLFSHDKGLITISTLLGLSWLLCNFIVVCAHVFPEVSIFQRPIKIALYALVDLTWLAMILAATRQSNAAKAIRYPLCGLYLAGMCAHVVVLLSHEGAMRLYYDGLDWLFGLELCVVSIAGIWVSASNAVRDFIDRSFDNGNSTVHQVHK